MVPKRRPPGMPMLIAALLSIAVLSAAPASAQAKCRTKCLAKKVNELTARVDALSSKLDATTSSLNSVTSCLRRRGVTQFGSPAEAFGYVYDDDGLGGASAFYTTGLDFDPSSPDIFVVRYTCTNIPIG